MPTTPTVSLPVTPPAASGRAPESPRGDQAARCDECGAAVAASQRYCVVCGSHRRQVDDPAERYLRRMSARPRGVPAGVAAAASAPPARPGRGRSVRSRGLGTALALALIPAAAAGGVLAGRSSTGGDAQLIQALAKRPPDVVTVERNAPVPATGSTAAAASTGGVAHAERGTHAHSAAKSPATAGGGKVIATSRYGSVQQVTGFKPTESQAKQGAQVTQQVQKSKGKAYVNSQDSLPAQVVVP